MSQDSGDYGAGFEAGGAGTAELVIDEDRRVFAPGDEVAGHVSWHLEEAPDRVAVRLYWRTEGRGSEDVETVAEELYEAPGRGDRRSFNFRLPEGPYSFSGTLISLIWGLELVSDPQGALGRVDVVVSHGPGEVVLTAVDPKVEGGGEAEGDGDGGDGAGETGRRFELPEPPGGGWSEP